MRLIPRTRNRQRHDKARIAITEAEISADLHYPAQLRGPRRSQQDRRAEIR